MGIVGRGVCQAAAIASTHTLEFDAGIPVALDGEQLSPVALIERLETLAGSYGIGRGIHLGDTVLGTKGRVAFEAPAAITLITAHRELEKLVLSAQQARVKDYIGIRLRRPGARGKTARPRVCRY